MEGWRDLCACVTAPEVRRHESRDSPEIVVSGEQVGAVKELVVSNAVAHLVQSADGIVHVAAVGPSAESGAQVADRGVAGL